MIKYGMVIYAESFITIVAGWIKPARTVVKLGISAILHELFYTAILAKFVSCLIHDSIHNRVELCQSFFSELSGLLQVVQFINVQSSFG